MCENGGVPLYFLFPLRKTLSSGFCFAAGYLSCEEQQRRGGGGDEGAEAANRAARARLPPGRGCGWCQRPVGKIHHQEGG